MLVNEMMRKTLACCLPDTPLPEVAQAMVEHDCGAIPIVESKQTMRLAGIITDRDITCRTIALGKNPMTMVAKDCLSAPTITVTPDTTLEDCCQVMAENQVRRIPVVDEKGICIGMVTQAQVTRHADNERIALMLKDISQPNLEASAVATERGMNHR